MSLRKRRKNMFFSDDEKKKLMEVADYDLFTTSHLLENEKDKKYISIVELPSDS